MQYDMYDKDTYFHSLPHKYRYGLLSVLEAKYNRKRSASQIKILASYKVVILYYYSNACPKVPRKKKSRTIVLTDLNHSNKSKTPNHILIKRYCVLHKKAEMPEFKYIPNIAYT